MQGCIALEELYLSHNGIAKMEGLSTLVNLRILDVSSNKLTSVDDIVNLTQYVCFSVSPSISLPTNKFLKSHIVKFIALFNLLQIGRFVA